MISGWEWPWVGCLQMGATANLVLSTAASAAAQIHTYKYTDTNTSTNTHIHKYKHKYTNTKIQAQIQLPNGCTHWLLCALTAHGCARVWKGCTARIECNRKVLLGLVPLFHLRHLKVAARSVHLMQAPQALAMQCKSYRWWHFNASAMVVLQCKPAIHWNEQLNASSANRCDAMHAALKRTTRYGGTSYMSSMQLNANPHPIHQNAMRALQRPQRCNPLKILIQAHTALHYIATGCKPAIHWNQIHWKA